MGAGHVGLQRVQTADRSSGSQSPAWLVVDLDSVIDGDHDMAVDPG
jgi:hypothetical protein